MIFLAVKKLWPKYLNTYSLQKDNLNISFNNLGLLKNLKFLCHHEKFGENKTTW